MSSTSRTEVNIKWVRYVMSDNLQLTVLMITKQLDIKEGQFGRLSPKICTCRKSAQKWCQDCWMRIRSTTCRYVRTSSNTFKLNQICFIDHQWWWYMDFWVQPGNQVPELRLKKAKQSKSKVKIMLIIFYDVRDITLTKFLPQEQMINQLFYKEILWCMLHLVHMKKKELR